ncbi:MAG TPA: DNA double-strand break repair nuclease NurA [Chloroflexota bacterium]
MLHSGRIRQALEDRREAFLRAAEESSRLQERYVSALRQLTDLRCEEIERRLSGIPWPGLRPTPELDSGGLVVPFGTTWASAQEARSWALNRLDGITTVAIDGSQIAPSKEFAVPLSLVQVAWFENPHSARRPYVKDVENEIVTSGEPGAEIEGYVFAESKLNQRRFALEMRVAAERVRSLPSEPPPVVFIDGSFVLSFIGRMAPESRQVYLGSLFGLLAAAEECRIPLAGYIDLSYAADLVAMLGSLFDVPQGNVFDAQILTHGMASFDRTAAMVCARSDVLPHYRHPNRDWSADICCVYLKIGPDRLPARIDFPRWILDAGLLDHMMDTIRAEIIVGSGYPYAVETADAAAVLTLEDRMNFYRLFHDFAQGAGLEFVLPGKSISKAHRR